MTVVCALIPRLALLAALGDRREMLSRPVALAPRPGGPQVVGEVSGAAEAFGVCLGMRLGEALARCPDLALVPPDAERADEACEELLRRLEEIGAAVEPGRAGEAFFEAEGLRPVCGGSVEGVVRRARRELRREVGGRRVVARLGAGPGRLSAYACAQRSRPGKPATIVPGGAERPFLAALPVGILRERLAVEARTARNPAAPGRGTEESAGIVGTLERLGVRTLGELAALPDPAVADRFGEVGLEALRRARGIEPPLRPRRRHEELVVRLELPDACSGPQLERALALLVDRLLAHPARRGRSLRRLRLAARLAGGGSWRVEVALREAGADRDRLRLALAPRLEELPGPASSLALRAVDTGAHAHDQPSLSRSPSQRRRERLAEAVRQTRAAAGPDAVLRVLDVDPDSRVPERRAMLTPYPDG